MEEEYKELLEDEEIVSLCSSINKLARERESLLDQAASNFLAEEAEGEILCKQAELRNLIFNKLHKEAQEKTQEQATYVPETGLEEIEASPISVSSLMGSDGKEVYYYAIIAKDHARKEMPDLVDAYPNHFYYAIICIETDEGQYVKIVQDKDGKMPYYPELDQAETQERRIWIMNRFLNKLPEKYIHAKYEDLFGE